MNDPKTPTTDRRVQIGDRRQAEKDRREMIRFEMDKKPRRSGKDRRISDLWAGRELF